MVPVCLRPPAHHGSGFLDSCAGVVEGGSLRCSVGGATRIAPKYFMLCSPHVYGNGGLVAPAVWSGG